MSLTPAPVGFTDAELLASLPAVRRYARALTRDADRAEDLVQAVAERALRKRHLFQPETNLMSWLLTLAHHSNVNEGRREAARPAGVIDEAVVERVPAPGTDPIAAIEVKEIRALLARLPRQQQRVLVLAALYGENYERMAAWEMVPVGTVRSRLSRGRAMLRLLARGTELSAEERGMLDAAAD